MLLCCVLIFLIYFDKINTGQLSERCPKIETMSPPETTTNQFENKIYANSVEDFRRNLFAKTDNASSSNLSETSTMVESKNGAQSGISASSHATNSSSSSWTDDPHAKYFLLQLLSVFYFLILLIYGIVLELSGWLIDKSDKANLARIHNNTLIFNLYLYIVSFIFFVYCYLMWASKQRIKYLWKKFQRDVWNRPEKMNGEIGVYEVEEHAEATALPVVGSFYLRFGAFIFAVIVCVYYGFAAAYRVFPALDICAIFFTILQTHLLCYSSTMFDERFYIVSCFGTMHLVAVNLITWVQYLFAKNQSTEKSIQKLFKKTNKYGQKLLYDITTTMSSLADSSEEVVDTVRRAASENSRSRIPYSPDCRGLECVFGSFTKIFYTAVVEYSLIAAVVMFIVWHNLGRKKSNRISHSTHQKSPPFPLKKLFFGLVGGFFFVIGTAVSMILFYVTWFENSHDQASLNFTITDVIHNSVGILACLFAFWRLRLLDFAHYNPHDPHHEIHANQELLDMILLAIGIIGELAFSISGLSGICSDKDSTKEYPFEWYSLTVLLAIARVLRIIQSICQSFLIGFALKLKSTTPDRHPGRQTITFLIILNMSMFIYQWFLSDKAGTYEGVISSYGAESWAFFVSIFSPLTVFFRFHSSVCFVEIWKHTYTNSH